MQSNARKISKIYVPYVGIKSVFSDWPYLLMVSVITIMFWVVFSTLDQLLFFSPILAFYVPESSITTFVLSTMIAVLIGTVSSMNLYALKHSRIRARDNKTGSTGHSAVSAISGSLIGVISGICAGCTPSVVSFITMVAGTSAGIMLFSYLSTYQNSLQILSLLLLLWGLWSVSSKISQKKYCNISANK